MLSALLSPKNACQTQNFFAAVNPNDIKILLANGLSTFFIKGKPVFNNGPRSIPKNPPNCTILDN